MTYDVPMCATPIGKRMCVRVCVYLIGNIRYSEIPYLVHCDTQSPSLLMELI